MNQHNYDARLREAITKRCLEGERVPAVAAEMSIPRSTLYLWVKKAKAAVAEQEQKYLDNKALDPASISS